MLTSTIQFCKRLTSSVCHFLGKRLLERTSFWEQPNYRHRITSFGLSGHGVVKEALTFDKEWTKLKTIEVIFRKKAVKFNFGSATKME